MVVAITTSLPARLSTYAMVSAERNRIDVLAGLPTILRFCCLRYHTGLGKVLLLDALLILGRNHNLAAFGVEAHDDLIIDLEPQSGCDVVPQQDAFAISPFHDLRH